MTQVFAALFSFAALWRRKPSICALLAVGLALGLRLAAQDTTTPQRTPVQVDLRELATQVGEKVRAGQTTPDALAPVLAQFDVLWGKYRGQPEAEAEILFHRAAVTVMFLKDEARAQILFEQIVADYPSYKQAEDAKVWLHAMSPEGKAERAAALAAHKAKLDALIGHTAPELELTWSNRAGLKRLADLRGQVVVLDFWATWCGPCIASFPKVRKEVAHFASSPVVFLGVTSLQGKVHGLEAKPIDVKDQPEKEYALTADFAKKHEMTWPIAFSSQNVFNPDYLVRGIPNVVIIAPDGTVRHVGLNPHTPGVDIQGKITAILQEFKFSLPSKS